MLERKEILIFTFLYPLSRLCWRKQGEGNEHGMTYAVPVRFVQEDPYLCFQLLLTSGSRYLGGDRPKAAKVSDTWIQWPSSRRIFILVVLPYCIEITGTFFLATKFELRHYRPASASYRKKVGTKILF